MVIPWYKVHGHHFFVDTYSGNPVEYHENTMVQKQHDTTMTTIVL